MDPVHIAKGEENAQENVDACLARLRQMMLDSDNGWDFAMSGDGNGVAEVSLLVGPSIPIRKPKTDFKAEAVANGPDAPASEEAPPAEVVAVAEAATDSPAE